MMNIILTIVNWRIIALGASMDAGQFNMLAGVVIAALVIGLAAGGIAWMRVSQEMKHLDSYISILKSNASSKKDLNDNLFTPTSRDERNYTMKRLLLIADIYGVTRKQGDDANTSLQEEPSLRDLHEITLNDERSWWATSLLRVLSSVLLIAGIFGTLWGVHSYLMVDNVKFDKLALALLPSMAAVGSTVILMLTRSVYTHHFYSFMTQFDSLTISTMLPLLRQNKQEHSADNLMDVYVSLEQRLEEFQKFSKQLADNLNSDKETIDGYVAQIDSNQKSIDDFTHAMSPIIANASEYSKHLEEELNKCKELDSESKKIQESQKSMLEVMQALITGVKTQDEALASFYRTNMNEFEKIQSIVSKYISNGELHKEHQDAFSNILSSKDTVMKAINDIKSKMSALKELGETEERGIQDFNEKNGSINELTEKVSRTIKDFDLDKQSIVELKEQLDATVTSYDTSIKLSNVLNEGLKRELQQKLSEMGKQLDSVIRLTVPGVKK